MKTTARILALALNSTLVTAPVASTGCSFVLGETRKGAPHRCMPGPWAVVDGILAASGPAFLEFDWYLDVSHQKGELAGFGFVFVEVPVVLTVATAFAASAIYGAVKGRCLSDAELARRNSKTSTTTVEARSLGGAEPLQRLGDWWCTKRSDGFGLCLHTKEECDRYVSPGGAGAGDYSGCVQRDSAYCAGATCFDSGSSCLDYERRLGNDGSACGGH